MHKPQTPTLIKLSSLYGAFQTFKQSFVFIYLPKTLNFPMRTKLYIYNLWYSFMLSHICFLDFSFYRAHLVLSVCIVKVISVLYCSAVCRSEIYGVFIGLQNSQILIQVFLILFITRSLYVVKKNALFWGIFICLLRNRCCIFKGVGMRQKHLTKIKERKFQIVSSFVR